MAATKIYSDELMNRALLLSGYKDKKKIIDESIKLFIAMQAQGKITDFRGKIKWVGDLESLRLSTDDNG